MRMPAADPEPGPEEFPAGAAGGPVPGWVPGVAESGSGPVPGPESGGMPGPGLPAGLDYQALLEGLAASGALDGDPGQQDAVLADELAAEADGRMRRCDLAGVAALAVEHMGPGAAQAGWLEVASAGVGRLDENALAGVAIAARRLASRVQAAELAAVAQITARAAAADPRVGVAADGRPAWLCRDALGQVSLALTLTDYRAGAWADLAVTLAWRLRATGAALAAGRIDLDRARVIAEATGVLPEKAARVVEARLLPGAAGVTTAYLRERARRAVIAADPEGAERRRRDAERRAEVRLHADDEQTATLVGSRLPQVHAAAGFARITALARARIAAGLPGSLNLHRAQVLLGLILGTLPYIPPAEDAPPDPAPPGPEDSGPYRGPGAARGPREGPRAGDADTPPGDGPGTARGCGPERGPWDDVPVPGDADAPPGDGPGTARGCGPERGPWDDVPVPGDADAPPGDRPGDRGGHAGLAADLAGDDDDRCPSGPVPDWPDLGAIPPALARRDGEARVPGLLDVLLPWTTLAGISDRPGVLGRIGPITAAQTRLLARAAEHDPAAQWRVIVTNAAGQAIAVTRIPRPRRGALGRVGPAGCRDGPWSARAGPPGSGLVGRVTVTITQDTLAAGQPDAPRPRARPIPPGSGQPVRPAWQARPAGPGPPRWPEGPGPPRWLAGPGPPTGIAPVVLRAAARALQRARAQAEADRAAGGCAHTAQSPAYRPPPGLREQVIARDVTCRNPVCRQPAWRADLDHTIPWDQGPTCSCNLGGRCRRHHILKQHPRWALRQDQHGRFTWITPAGRSYSTGPDTYPV